MNDDILKAIDEELARLHQVRAILGGTVKTSPAVSAPSAEAKPRRKLSAKARRAIADAQRKRWAKVNSLKKAAAAEAS